MKKSNYSPLVSTFDDVESSNAFTITYPDVNNKTFHFDINTENKDAYVYQNSSDKLSDIVPFRFKKEQESTDDYINDAKQTFERYLNEIIEKK